MHSGLREKKVLVPESLADAMVSVVIPAEVRSAALLASQVDVSACCQVGCTDTGAAAIVLVPLRAWDSQVRKAASAASKAKDSRLELFTTDSAEPVPLIETVAAMDSTINNNRATTRTTPR